MQILKLSKGDVFFFNEECPQAPSLYSFDEKKKMNYLFNFWPNTWSNPFGLRERVEISFPQFLDYT